MWVGNLFLLVLNLPIIGLWVRLLSIPYHLLYPIILVFTAVGVDPKTENQTWDGRPIALVKSGRPIEGLVE